MEKPPLDTATQPRASPRLHLRVVLLGLPFAGGAGLVLHILANVSLPLGIAALAVLGAAIWLVVGTRLRPAARRLLLRRVGVGTVAGLIGTVAYDLVRYGVVAAFSMSLRPFHVFTVFGELFIGANHPAATLFVVGLFYHLSNGMFFGVAYTIVIRRPAWWSGALWGIGLELCMATLYPSWLRIQMLAEFLEVSAIGHLVYGSVLGLVAARGLAIAGRTGMRGRP